MSQDRDIIVDRDVIGIGMSKVYECHRNRDCHRDSDISGTGISKEQRCHKDSDVTGTGMP